uniref:Uncharacterized protein n=1 Tax=Arundo donax TaxID=35708 RepID=A0A0A9BGK3_ARUDO
MSFEKKFSSKPTEILFSAMSFLHKWKVLLKENQRLKVEASQRLMDWISNFAPNAILVSDVVEI